ncbi:hypothetical protein ARMGADRAFT_1032537 [Armillaria gallica]|uniref:Uncharacterized protein n=1 Tax=Armillaria gallica TaxID=47427 RepID=A0A2H3D5K8_ARMGA|nr:hypothetical protein ARMGADRAFT_1032537 [Armillaria gallica]
MSVENSILGTPEGIANESESYSKLKAGGELIVNNTKSQMQDYLTASYSFERSYLPRLKGPIWIHSLPGDPGSIAPALAHMNPKCPLPSPQYMSASNIQVVPVREPFRKQKLPFIYAVTRQRQMTLGGRVYCSRWYGNGRIVTILLVTSEFTVFTAEFSNPRYAHGPFSITFITYTHLFQLPVTKRWLYWVDRIRRSLPKRLGQPKLTLVQADVEEAMQQEFHRNLPFMSGLFYGLLTDSL